MQKRRAVRWTNRHLVESKLTSIWRSWLRFWSARNWSCQENTCAHSILISCSAALHMTLFWFSKHQTAVTSPVSCLHCSIDTSWDSSAANFNAWLISCGSHWLAVLSGGILCATRDGVNDGGRSWCALWLVANCPSPPPPRILLYWLVHCSGVGPLLTNSRSATGEWSSFCWMNPRNSGAVKTGNARFKSNPMCYTKTNLPLHKSRPVCQLLQSEVSPSRDRARSMHSLTAVCTCLCLRQSEMNTFVADEVFTSRQSPAVLVAIFVVTKSHCLGGHLRFSCPYLLPIWACLVQTRLWDGQTLQSDCKKYRDACARELVSALLTCQRSSKQSKK